VEQISRIGMDTSKHFFQLHGVNAPEKVVLRKKLRRKEMVAFFKTLAPTIIGIEACGASHHWARLLQSFGHQVKLIAPQQRPSRRAEDLRRRRGRVDRLMGLGWGRSRDEGRIGSRAQRLGVQMSD
jgi:transposase